MKDIQSMLNDLASTVDNGSIRTRSGGSPSPSVSYTLDYDDATHSLELKSDGVVASTVDLTTSVGDALKDGFTTDHIDGLLYLYPRLEEGITKEHSNVTGGVYFTPRKVKRGNGSIIMCMPVGGITVIKGSGSLQNLLGRTYIEAGDTFDITNALANSGNAPYIAGIMDGGIAEVTDIDSTLKKRFLGAGTYMALTKTELPSKKSWVLVMKVGAAVQ